MTLHLTDANFEKEVATLGRSPTGEADKFVLVDFFATWCGPCNTLGPILEKVTEQFKDKVVLAKVNVDEAPIASQKFNVDKIPCIALLKNGKQINGFVGLVPENSIKEWLENAIKD